LTEVALFAGHFVPAVKGGGPIASIRNFVAQAQGTNVRIVCGDRDLGDTTAFPGLPVNQPVEVAGARVRYIRPGSVRHWISVVRDLRADPPDAYYLNSLMSRLGSLVPLLLMRVRLLPRRPTLLATRGECSEAALRRRSGRKRAFLRLAGLIGLHRDVVFQASTTAEERDIRAVLGARVEVMVSSNALGPPVRAVDDPRPTLRDPMRVLYLGRIARIKNVDDLIQGAVRAQVPMELRLYGAMEDPKYWDRCQGLIESAPAHVEITYEGVAASDAVTGLLLEADLLAMVSSSENFGQSVAEALGHGCPVLITDTIPWAGPVRDGAGWVVSVGDIDAIAQGFAARAAASEEEVAAMRAACAEAVEKWQTAAGGVPPAELFPRLIAGGW
jgi:glycosyltransferase involved in cell wall biosynthesis